MDTGERMNGSRGGREEVYKKRETRLILSIQIVGTLVFVAEVRAIDRQNERRPHNPQISSVSLHRPAL